MKILSLWSAAVKIYLSYAYKVPSASFSWKHSYRIEKDLDVKTSRKC